mgnify:CR=1 FL=1
MGLGLWEVNHHSHVSLYSRASFLMAMCPHCREEIKIPHVCKPEIRKK